MTTRICTALQNCSSRTLRNTLPSKWKLTSACLHYGKGGVQNLFTQRGYLSSSGVNFSRNQSDPIVSTFTRSYTTLTRGKDSIKEKEPKITSTTTIDQLVVDNVRDIKDGKFESVTNPEDLQHFKSKPLEAPVLQVEPPVGEIVLPHPIWSEEDVYSVKITHKAPEKFADKMALLSVKLLRKGFDVFSGFNRKPRNEAVWLNRISFLETVAGVPGMVAAMTRHLHSLRRMRRDHGWIHTLLEEAENERMHLMTALTLKKPSLVFRTAVVGSQGVFVTFFSFAYLISPRYCHRFVGYLEEEAVVTYTKCLQDIETGLMQHWKTQIAPDVALRYWKLASDSTMKDVILAIRADEAHHRVVNHTLASLKPDDYNPYRPGQ